MLLVINSDLVSENTFRERIISMSNEEKLEKALELLTKTWVTVDFFCHKGDLNEEVRGFLNLCRLDKKELLITFKE